MQKKVFLLLLVWVLFLGGKIFSSQLNIDRPGGKFVEQPVSNDPVRDAKYDGNDVVVRIYEDLKNEPKKYRSVSLEISNGDKIEFGRYDFPDDCVVAIIGDDQDNTVIKDVLKNSVFISNYTKNLKYSISGYLHSERLTCFFKDGNGDVVPDGKVEVFAHESSESAGVFFKEYELQNGLLEGPFFKGRWRTFSFIFSHPEYGKARVIGYDVNNVVHLPLVQEESEADASSVYGAIVGPGEVPLAGIEIWCSEIRTLGEGLVNLLNSNGNSYIVISDTAGKFRMYPPNQKNIYEHRGDFIPPRSRFYLHTKLPKESEFRSYDGWVSNDDVIVIHLDRKEITEYTEQFTKLQGGNYHRFVFKDEYGEKFSREEQKEIVIYINRKDKPRLRLSPGDWENGGVFPNGIYDASILKHNSWREMQLKFKDITVTDESPTDLVFESGDTIRFFGSVVDGRDNTPYVGAFVILMEGVSKFNLSDVNSVEWEKLHLLSNEPKIDDPALKPIQKIYGFQKILFTDEEGKFEFEILPDYSFWGIVVFDENWLPIELDAVNRMRRMEKPIREFDFGKVRMFPAAKVFVKTVLEDRVNIMPGWGLVGKNNPAWAKNITDIHCNWLKNETKEKQSFNVPAEVRLKLKFTMPYDDWWWSKDDFEEIYLEQGEIHDCGVLKLEPSIGISVVVVDPNDNAVEGVPLEMEKTVVHITDINGRAKFYVLPNSEGKVGVRHYGENEHLKKIIEYKVGGKEDQDKEFKIELSEEELKILGL